MVSITSLDSVDLYYCVCSVCAMILCRLLVSDAHQVAAGLRMAETDEILLRRGTRQVRHLDYRCRLRIPERISWLH